MKRCINLGCHTTQRCVTSQGTSVKRAACCLSGILAFIMSDFHIIQEIEGDFKGPRQALVCGVRVPFYLPIVDSNFEKDLSRFETREDDVYIVTYPKSGKLQH